ncbi:MAG: hypothetical protein ACRD0U_15480 [Acidimicrobiales bacterium]
MVAEKQDPRRRRQVGRHAGRKTVLQRLNVGLIAILGRLGAEATWRRVAEEMWPVTDGPPSTALGHEEARWWATRDRRPRPPAEGAEQAPPVSRPPRRDEFRPARRS